MSRRQIILDTETTGLRVEEGHRVIEIGCIELIDRQFTGNTYHQYLNPEREIDQGAIAIHGITNDFLADKPKFKDIATQFLDFLQEAELIIHNASFDLSFLDNEFSLAQFNAKQISATWPVVDTLQIARQLHVGQRNNLDALCKRYHIDNAKRELHGALLDAHLLAQVYLAMTGGQGSFFELLQDERKTNYRVADKKVVTLSDEGLIILKANENELLAHENYLTMLKSHGRCLWKEDVDVNSKSS